MAPSLSQLSRPGLISTGLPAITNADRTTRASETGDGLILRAETITVVKSQNPG